MEDVMKMVSRVIILLFVAFGLSSFFSVNVKAQSAFVTLINRSNDNLFQLYATPAYANGWGDDRLPVWGLPPGYRQTFSLSDGLNTCYWHLKIVTLSGVEINRWNQYACGGFTWTIYDR
jgi:hypothetical protein